MANSRLEKIGTIYSRARGLIQSGAMEWQDRPLWYDLYEAFPPKEEPRFDRPAPQIPLRKIFYQEDKIRAMFHKRNKHIGIVNLSNNTTQTLTQRFIKIYQKLENQYDDSISPDKIYEEAIEMLQKEREKRFKGDGDEHISLKKSFEDAQKAESKEEPSLNIKMYDLFKE